MIFEFVGESKGDLLVVANALLLIAASLVLILQRCIYGQLPYDEVEDIFKKYIHRCGVARGSETVYPSSQCPE